MKLPNQLSQRILPFWKHAQKLYSEKTKLFYDYLYDRSEDSATKNLPTLEEIAACSPNPCGWGTGMEDSMLNGGNMLEAVLALYNRTKDESLKPLADEFFEGMYTCATVSKQNGYLARSVSPIDNKSHYINSSRDQYTHWIYCGYAFYNSPLSSPEQKEKIKSILVSFAEKAEHDVKQENAYCLLREDGEPDIRVGLMYGNGVVMHEALRLPMFYLAAYHVSGNKHWKEKYLEYRDWALDRSEKIYDENAFRIFKYAYALLQMQYSVKLTYEIENDESYKKRYLKLMQRVAEHAKTYLQNTKENVCNYPQDKIMDWRNPKQWHYLGTFYNRPYFLPNMYGEDSSVSYFVIMRNGAEAMIIQALCPDFQIPQETVEDFLSVVDRARPQEAMSYWPILFCDAWALLEEKKFL